MLFAAYLIFFCWLVSKIKFFKNSGLDRRIIIGLFLLKVSAGALYGYISSHFSIISDNWAFHNDGVLEFRLLLSDPQAYVTNIFKNNYNEGLSRVLDAENSFWNDLRSNLIAKLLSVFNIFSNCNYYINNIFFNFLIFFGVFSIYHVFHKIFPTRKLLLIIPVFLLPSFLYYTSGIHRDGLILLGIGLSVYGLFFAIRVDRFSISRMVLILLGLGIIFLFRNFVFVPFLPAILAWIFAEKFRKYALQTFTIIYLIFIILFFNVGRIHPRLDLPKYVSDRQLQFVALSGGSTAVPVNPLFPNFRSFMNNAPQAFNHSLMRPYITETPKLIQLPVSIEILLYEIIFLVFLFFRRRQNTDPFIFFSIFFALSMLLIIGYTVPIFGAIARYRSVYFPFLLTPLICMIEWKKISEQFHIRK